MDDPRFWITLLNDTMVLFGGLQDIPLKEYVRWDQPNVEEVFYKVGIVFSPSRYFIMQRAGGPVCKR